MRIELWHKRRLRKRLIRILNQASVTRRHVAEVRQLQRQGADGSRLREPEEDGDSVAKSSGPPPRELLQLLAVEDRIRQLRHLIRISHARIAAVRSAQRLALLRQHPLKRAAIRLTQLVGAITLGRAARRLVADVVAQRNAELNWKKVMLPDELKDALRSPELRALWEIGQSLFDFSVQNMALRALQGLLMPRVSRTEHRIPDTPIDAVKGIGPAKLEALEIIECLMAPTRFAGLGAKCPKGLLLTGPPGCGKTMLARAIASTASVPFISRSGADFNQRYAGGGVSLVKEIFRTARSVAPSVILIDELDYIGRKRGEERGGGLETDRSAALTQLLAEMDGFNPTEGVVVIATTNRPDILDKALLRPGRFDRRVNVPLPDVQGRLQILKKHAERLAVEPPNDRRLTGPINGTREVDWPGWAKRTAGFSGADLAGLVNEAALAAVREGARGIGERHVQLAYSKAIIGVPSGRRRSEKEMALVAAHEAGHAVVNEAVRVALEAEGASGFRTVAHISIVPAGGTGGVTQFAEAEEGSRPPESRRVLLGVLAVAMGGRAAEELLGQATMGAASDFAEATRLATQMITVGGLSDEVGPRSLEAGLTPSQDLQNTVDKEIDKLLRQALRVARDALQGNRALQESIVEALRERETLDGSAFRQLVEQHRVAPAQLIPL